MRVVYLLFILATSVLWQSEGQAADLIMGGSKVLGLLPMVASENGYFKEAGIEVEHEIIPVGKLAMDAVLSDHTDLGFLVDANIAFNSFHDNDLTVIATIMGQYTDGIIGCRNSGALVVEDLRSKRIGYLPATTSHVYLARLLKSSGMNLSDINPVMLQPASMQPALSAGMVDYVSIWNPWRYTIMKAAGKECQQLINNRQLYPTKAYLVVRKTTLINQAVSLKKFLKAIIRAEKWVKNNEQSALRFYARANRMSESHTRSLWDHIEPVVELSDEAVRLVDEISDWIPGSVKGFASSKKRAVESYFFPGLLREVSANRVTLREPTVTPPPGD